MHLSLKTLLLSICFLSIPIFGWMFFSSFSGMDGWGIGPKGQSILHAGKDFQKENEGKKLSAIPDSEMLSSFDRLKGGFQSMDFSLISEKAFAAESIPKNVKKEDAPDDKEKKTLTNSYDIGDVLVTTDYRESKNKQLGGFSPVKQTITLKNTADTERTIDFSNRIKISAGTVVWDNQPYTITEEPQTFTAYEKTASIPEFAKDTNQKDTDGVEAFKNYTHTYMVGMNLTFDGGDHPALYDWSDAITYNPEIKVYKTKEGNFIEFSIKQITIPGKGETVIDPNFGLNDTTAYDIRYDGGAASDQLTLNGAIAIGDVNGDGKKDLVIGASSASNNGASSGSAYVIFGGTGIAMGNKPLSTAGNYNIRYDGDAASNGLTSSGGIAIGDVNGDSLSDLVLGENLADNNGASSGSAYVMFSTLIDDVGTSTGINKPLNTGTNYNIRYDGGTASEALTLNAAIAIGDVNGDSSPDLVLGSSNAVYNGASTGSAYVMFSTLIDDVGTTTGNNKPLNTGTNYNIRYDGEAPTMMTASGAIAIGDINGDSLPDLVLGGYNASFGGRLQSGSAYVVFSTLIDDVGATTGNNKPFSTLGNYNIRYDGATLNDRITIDKAIAIGDVNGDTYSDLVLGSYIYSSSSGAAYVMFSTLIDDVGTSTDNVKVFNSGTSYNIRYSGSAASASLTKLGAIGIGDINGDSLPDLVLGACVGSGSAYVMFSTLIDDVGTSTGINKPFSTITNYNVRYDGDAAGNQLTQGGIAIGDINGDSLSDLVLGESAGDNNGSNSGSAYVMFSTLIDDVGATTGNNKPLNTGSNYTVRYDGDATTNTLTSGGIVIGDINGDTYPDLVLGENLADNNGGDSGSAWVIFGGPTRFVFPEYTLKGIFDLQGPASFQ